MSTYDEFKSKYGHLGAAQKLHILKFEALTKVAIIHVTAQVFKNQKENFNPNTSEQYDELIQLLQDTSKNLHEIILALTERSEEE